MNTLPVRTGPLVRHSESVRRAVETRLRCADIDGGASYWLVLTSIPSVPGDGRRPPNDRSAVDATR